ncbi:hypothetical protein KT99_06602 [Shewanella benthica KT99]|uniref:Uncharacterized protein n=1 Tax=Shewanella benthica KT99 TaxID=314608 RepID=A9CV94_9GAMM|nr:hypothetical protein KT99_06602 [Shewanella benthica KT99]
MISAASLLLIILAYVGLLYVVAALDISAESGGDANLIAEVTA